MPLLPSFPMETWNFRIAHVAGALGLGFMLYAGRLDFPGKDEETPAAWYIAYLLMVPALFSLGTAVSFAVRSTTASVERHGSGIKFNETYLFGLPLIVATRRHRSVWFHKRERSGFAAPDIVLAVCGARSRPI
jgi:hypothetical protein